MKSVILSSVCLETGTDIQLALYYLKSYLLRHSHIPSAKVQIRVFHESQASEEIARMIAARKPAVAAFSCYLWNIGKILRVCRSLKKIDPSIVTVLGGPEVTPRAAELAAQEKQVDVLVRGEGEKIFSVLCKELFSGKGELARVPGITFRKGRDVVSTPDMPALVSLADIPSPFLGGLVNLKDKDILDIPLETSRGCSSRCSYCFYHKNSPRVRHFPLSRVEQELKLILAHKPHEVYLMDATFNADPVRAKKILRMFIRYNRGSNLHVELKAELVDEEMARLLSRANAYNIEIGIQATNPRTLKAIRRGLPRERFRRGIRLLNKYKLYYEVQLIDALPFQGYEDIKRSLDWLYSMHPAKVAMFRLAMLPGTALRNEASRYGLEYADKPPYWATRSNALSSREVKRLEKMCFAMERLYDSQVFQKTLYELRDKHKVRISDVMDDFIDWESRFKKRGYAYVEFLNKKLPDFLKYVCRTRRIPLPKQFE